MKTRLLLNPPSLSVTSRNLKLPQKLCGFERIWKSSPHSAALMTAAAAAVVCSLFALHPGMMISNISNDAFSDVFSAVVRASRRALRNVDVVSSSFQPSPRPCLTWTCRRTAGGTPENRRNEAESPAEPSVSQSVRRSGGQPLTSAPQTPPPSPLPPGQPVHPLRPVVTQLRTLTFLPLSPPEQLILSFPSESLKPLLLAGTADRE